MIISDVNAGELQPRIAPRLTTLMQLHRRVLEKTEFEKRLAESWSGYEVARECSSIRSSLQLIVIGEKEIDIRLI